MRDKLNGILEYEYENSVVRKNLLNWYPFKANETMLLVYPVGRILYQYLSGVLRKVEFINQENDEFYDYILMMGGITDEFVLDVEQLKRLKKHLKTNGKLILAMDNSLGMRYWAGAAEESTGMPYVGLEGYAGKKRLSDITRISAANILEDSGFGPGEFYYPFPDYLFPTEIYSDDFLPKQGDLRGQSPAYFGMSYGLFKEDRVYEKICRDHMFPYFSNSFLIITQIKTEG